MNRIIVILFNNPGTAKAGAWENNSVLSTEGPSKPARLSLPGTEAVRVAICQERVYLKDRIEELFSRFNDLIAEHRLNLDQESWTDKLCRVAEWRAVIEHTKGLQQQLAEHSRIHHCGVAGR